MKSKNKKRIKVLASTALITSMFLAQPASAWPEQVKVDEMNSFDVEQNVSMIFKNGKAVQTLDAMTVSGAVFVSVDTFKSIGYEVKYDPILNVTTIYNGITKIVVDNSTLKTTINDNTVEVEMMQISNTLYLNLDSFSELAKMDIEFDSSNKNLYIKGEKQLLTVSTPLGVATISDYDMVGDILYIPVKDISNILYNFEYEEGIFKDLTTGNSKNVSHLLNGSYIAIVPAIEALGGSATLLRDGNKDTLTLSHQSLSQEQEEREELTEARTTVISATLKQNVETKVLSASTRTIKIILDGKETVPTDVHPEIVQSRTFIPLRFVSENMGYSVDWNASTRTATVVDQFTHVIGNTYVTLPNGQKIDISVPSYVKNQRTMVSLRLFAEALGAEVEWGMHKTTLSL